MHKCFKIWVEGCQNDSTGNLIRLSKFQPKNLRHSEDVNKMPSEFPQSKMFPANGMHSIYFQLQCGDDTFPADGNIDEPY